MTVEIKTLKTKSDQTMDNQAKKAAAGDPDIFNEIEKARKRADERIAGGNSDGDENDAGSDNGQESPEETETAPSVSAPAIFDTPAYEPPSNMEVEDPPPPRAAKGGKGRAGIGAGREKKNIFKKLLPHDQQLLVYWRNERGKYEFEDSYEFRDVMDAGSIEAFLKKTVGPGEYQLEIKDNKGEISKAGTIRIRAPREGDVSAMPHKQIYEMQRQMAENAKREGDEKFKLVAEMAKAMGNKEDGGAAILPLVMMMMKPDPNQQLITMMMMERLDRANQAPPSLPVPPALSVPPSGGTSEAVEMVKILAELTKMQTPQQPNIAESLMNLVLTTLQKNDRSDVKDLLEIMAKSREILNPGASDFNTQLAHYDKIQERLDRMSQRESGAGSIFSQLGESLASTVNAFRDLKLMSIQQMEQMGQPMGQRVTVMPSQGNNKPLPGAQIPPGEMNMGAISPGAGTEMQNQPTAPPRKAVPPLIPSGFRRFIIQMKKAFNDGDEKALINFFLEGLKFLFERGDQRWLSHIEKFVEKVLEGDQENALKFVYAFLRSFEANKLINEEIAETIYHSVEVYFEDIRQTFQQEFSSTEQTGESPPVEDTTAEEAPPETPAVSENEGKSAPAVESAPENEAEGDDDEEDDE